MDILLVGPKLSSVDLDDQTFHVRIAQAYAELFLPAEQRDEYGLHASMTIHHAVNGRAADQLREGLGMRDGDVMRTSLLLADAHPSRSTFQTATWFLAVVSGRMRGASMLTLDRVLTERKSWAHVQDSSLEAWLEKHAREESEVKNRCAVAPHARRERRFVLAEPLAFGLLPDLFFQLFLNTHPELDALPKNLLRLPRAKR